MAQGVRRGDGRVETAMRTRWERWKRSAWRTKFARSEVRTESDRSVWCCRLDAGGHKWDDAAKTKRMPRPHRARHAPTAPATPPSAPPRLPCPSENQPKHSAYSTPTLHAASASHPADGDAAEHAQADGGTALWGPACRRGRACLGRFAAARPPRQAAAAAASPLRWRRLRVVRWRAGLGRGG